MRLKFGKAQKIKGRKEISHLFKTGQRWECDSFVLIFGQNDFEHDRLGVIVYKKLGNAVVRNKIKRVFREVYRLNQKNVPPFFDVLIRPKIKGVDFRWDVGEQGGKFNKWLESRF